MATIQKKKKKKTDTEVHLGYVEQACVLKETVQIQAGHAIYIPLNRCCTALLLNYLKCIFRLS